ncbi:MAG TPA: glycosyltransferase family 4 protein [Thermoanaerobaculia bacterium]|jgi:glycosyltransferase involved in cell wall biosynthesis|nr:glycosyltransferase family 4 protein [Thermoanaerobaculia bacterium]
MTRIALLSSEPIRARMAGIGIRYLEFARRLPREEIDVVLFSPALPEEMARLGGLGGVEVRHFERGRLAALLGDCDGAVAQGQLANDLVLEMPGLPVAIDLYDPWLIENFAYFETLGLDPYRNDHATWGLQMARGDFFLCSSEEQRTFYLGFLTAAGRVNPERIAGDPDLATLIAPVPFGVPDELPPHHPVLPARAPGERRLLFGGLYDWYDPWTLLDALAQLDRPGWTLLLIRNPNPESTPQRLFARVEARCRELGWWGTRVQALDWVPAERRYDLLRDVDLLVAPHRPSLETRLSLRTRFLDALAAGCPVVTSEGGAMSRLLAEHHAGWIAPTGDAPALARALAEALDDPLSRQAGARTLVERFRWDNVLAPLVAFCRDPRIDDTKERFGQRPATAAPADRLAFRLRRRLRQWGWGA